MTDLPNLGIRVHRDKDGSYWIPRAHAKAELYFNRNFLKVEGELRWIGPIQPNERIEKYSGSYSGRNCYIIAKGPSIDDLDEGYFKDPDAPIICINESIHKIEPMNLPNPLFFVQADIALKSYCRFERATAVLPIQIHNYYKDRNRILFSTKHFTWQIYRSCQFAIHFAKYIGCKKLFLLCFDACVNGRTDYGLSIDTRFPNRDHADYPTHRKGIIDITQDIDVEWIIPNQSTPVEPSFDIPVLS